MIDVGDLFVVWNQLWVVTGPMTTEGGKSAWTMSALHDMSDWMWDYEEQMLLRTDVYRRVA